MAMFLLLIASGLVAAQDDGGDGETVSSLPGSTSGIVNLRSGPGSDFEVLEIVAYQTPLSVLGRNASGTWLRVSVQGIDGWMSASYVDVRGSISALPVLDVNDNLIEAGAEITDDAAAPEGEASEASDAASSSSSSNVSVPSTGTTLRGVTDAIVNLRSGPGTNFDILDTVAYRTSLSILGRNQRGTWVLVSAQGQQGWLSSAYVSISGDPDRLAVVDEDGSVIVPATGSTSSSSDGEDGGSSVGSLVPGDGPAPDPSVVPPITGIAGQIFSTGQSRGNRSTVFSVVGDSISTSRYYLDPIGQGIYDLGPFSNLQPVIDHFRSSTNSFTRLSLAARSGWTSADALNPTNATSGLCDSGETPLECEYRVNRPAVALIMFGTNDVVNLTLGEYRANMGRIVDISIEMGVIPVLSTIPNQPGSGREDRVFTFNNAIRDIAQSAGVPLWDFSNALAGLPNQGIGGDNIHPSFNTGFDRTADFTESELRYGYNMRNLTALQVLEAIWRSVIL